MRTQLRLALPLLLVLALAACSDSPDQLSNQPTITGPSLSATQTACIGDFVWNDVNQNGCQDGGELGIEGVQRIPDERVLAADPDVLLVNEYMQRLSASDIVPESLRGLRAVREENVVVLPGRHLATVSKHVVDATRTLAKRLHPEAFR